MKIQDNRHLKHNEILQVGDMVITEDERKYIFSYDNEADYQCLQIDLRTFEVVTAYKKDIFNSFKVGTSLDVGGTIVEIIKSKNLILDIRS